MSTRNSGKSYIFVGGSPRSGTTLVQNVLGSHDDICGLPEYWIVKMALDLRERMLQAVQVGDIDNDVCTEDNVDERIADFVASFLDPSLNKYGTQYVSEKTPNNVLVFDGLLHIFPEAKFIHVVRDPRATIASFFAVGKKEKERNVSIKGWQVSIRMAIDYLKRHYQAGFDAVKQYPGRVLSVSYEHLVEDPQKITKDMCQFLGLQWDEKMITPGRQKQLGEKSMTRKRTASWYDKEKFDRNIEKTSLEKWKKELSSSQQVRIAEAFKDDVNLQKLGYNFSLEYMPSMKRRGAKLASDLRSMIGNLRMALSR